MSDRAVDDRGAMSAASWALLLWGVGGVVAVLVRAVVGLFPLVVEALHDHPMTLPQWIFLGVWAPFMLFSEGYRGFQTSFAPRVVARGFYLTQHPTWLRGLLAPLFCIGYFDADKRTMIVAWAVTLSVVSAVLLVSMIAQPWRGIIDLGVILGLVWGIGVIAALLGRGPRADADPKLPGQDSESRTKSIVD